MSIAALDRYRRAGASLPFVDPVRDHGAAFEGYYWRFTDAARSRVVIALCGLSRSEDGRWALVAVAEHPSGVVRTAVVPHADGDREEFAVWADGVVSASTRSVRFALGPEDHLAVEISQPVSLPRRPFGASGVAQSIPGLSQYWQPYLLGGQATGSVTLAGERIALEGANVYAEKNWGTSFPARWWWGQADAFHDGDACIAFAGGPVRVSGLAMRATLLVARIGERALALAPPLALASADVGEHGWRIRARSALYRVEIEGEDDGSGVALPVPVPGRRAAEPRSHQALAGRLRVRMRRGTRTVFAGESALAGLERER